MRILINTISTKKHSGGAYQIAFNFISKTLEHDEVEWIYVVSKDLDEILSEKIKTTRDYYVFPTQPDFKHSYKQVKKELAELEERLKPDVVYSITAPSYFSFVAPEVMRFTNPWLTHPNKYAWSVLPIMTKIRYFLYGLNQKRLMKKCHYFITQTETCAEGIRRITGVSKEHVKVVNNVLPAVFKSMANSPIKEDNYINIACVGAATTHKNFDIIPDVLQALNYTGVNNVRFHVTLPDDEPTLSAVEKKLKLYGLSGMLVNHGRLTQIELGDMYRRCQLCFLPTLLEVFSASTVEAMFFQLPIIATDFSFNREVMGDACLYYEPMNAKEAAMQIKRYIEDESLQHEMKQKMAKQLTAFSDYDKHFNDILVFLMEVGNKVKGI